MSAIELQTGLRTGSSASLAFGISLELNQFCDMVDNAMVKRAVKNFNRQNQDAANAGERKRNKKECDEYEGRSVADLIDELNEFVGSDNSRISWPPKTESQLKKFLAIVQEDISVFVGSSVLKGIECVGLVSKQVGKVGKAKKESKVPKVLKFIGSKRKFEAIDVETKVEVEAEAEVGEESKTAATEEDEEEDEDDSLLQSGKINLLLRYLICVDSWHSGGEEADTDKVDAVDESDTCSPKDAKIVDEDYENLDALAKYFLLDDCDDESVGSDCGGLLMPADLALILTLTTPKIQQ